MSNLKTEIKEIIVKDAFERHEGREDLEWIFDFRKVTLTPHFLDL